MRDLLVTLNLLRRTKEDLRFNDHTWAKVVVEELDKSIALLEEALAIVRPN